MNFSKVNDKINETIDSKFLLTETVLKIRDNEKNSHLNRKIEDVGFFYNVLQYKEEELWT